MKKKAAVILLVLAAIGQLAAKESRFLALFDGGIGVIPASTGTGTPNQDGTLPNVRANVVRGVSPGAGPWRIAELKAAVDAEGRIFVKGRGLLLAGGNGIGQNGNQSVFATLICEPVGPFVERNTTATVPLDQNGDFRMNDVLVPAPAECPSPVLLIRSAGSGAWFAAGIRKLGDDD